MQLVAFAVSFAIASLIPAEVPQQPLQASLGIAYRPGKIDFQLAAVLRDAVLDAERAIPPVLTPGGDVLGPVVFDATAAGSDGKRDPAVDATGTADATGSRPQLLDSAVDATIDGTGAKDQAIPVDARAIPSEPALDLAGSPAALVLSMSPSLTHFFNGLPPLLTDGFVLQVGALDEQGKMYVSRYAAEFPAGRTIYAQAVMLVGGQILASDLGKFTGTGGSAK